MSIRSKADWLMGFIESLECSDSISQKQLKLLKERLMELLKEIKEDFTVVEEDEEYEKKMGLDYKLGIKDKEEDDLPF